MIEWDRLQKLEIPKIIGQDVHTQGQLMELDFDRGKRIKKGTYDIVINRTHMILSDKNETRTFDISQISGMILAQHNFLTFDYDLKTFMIEIEDPMLSMDIINYIKGE